MKKRYIMMAALALTLASCNRDVSHIKMPATTTVTVNVTLPDAEFGEYQQNRVLATQPYNLRGVAEFYPKGKSAAVSHVTALLLPPPRLPEGITPSAPNCRLTTMR